MIDLSKEVVKALKTVLPTYYEMVLHSGIKTPCISYMELSNVATEEGDTLGHSRITYQIKVWATKAAEIQKYSLLIDKVMRTLNFKRISTNEIQDRNSTMIQKILNYEILTEETF